MRSLAFHNLSDQSPITNHQSPLPSHPSRIPISLEPPDRIPQRFLNLSETESPIPLWLLLMIKMLAIGFFHQELNRCPTDQRGLPSDARSELTDRANQIQSCHRYFVTRSFDA